MRKRLAKILFWIGDKASYYDSSFTAWLYVNCMRWSDKLVPWPEIEEQLRAAIDRDNFEEADRIRDLINKG